MTPPTLLGAQGRWNSLGAVAHEKVGGPVVTGTRERFPANRMYNYNVGPTSTNHREMEAKVTEAWGVMIRICENVEECLNCNNRERVVWKTMLFSSSWQGSL